MPTSPNKLAQFWQELKRRKVVCIITVYAAAAFVILEQTDIIALSPGEADKPLSSNSWGIDCYISFVVIVVLIVLNIIPHSTRAEEEAILDNLCKINNLGVVSRISVAQYRSNLKPVQEIAKEMNVSSVLEGSGMKDEPEFQQIMIESFYTFS